MPATSVAQAIRFIFHGSPPSTNPNLRIFDYGDEKVFRDLWLGGLDSDKPTINRQAYDWTQTGQQVLIIGNDPPRTAFEFLKRPGMPPVDVRQHFSACSWAAAFRLLNPQAGIHVVIVESGQRSSMLGAGADLARVFRGNGGQSVVPGVTVLCFPDLAEIVAAAQQPPPPALTTGQMGVLRGIIQQHLLPNGEDHHKMGNIVGALMLDPQPGNGVRILGSLFRALQPDTKFEAVEPQVVAPVDEALKARLRSGPQFVLFDDMGSLWRPFLSRWIPDSRLHIPEVTVESRIRLTDRIKTLATEPVQRRRLKASDFGVTAIADDEPFVLLLDLRLFAGDKRDEEADFVYQLKETAERAADAAHLKWPVIAENELKAGIEAWYEKQSFSPAFRRTRSWLPRLISLIDPPLPIIVFSSTQDPEVLKEFRAYGNIITDFAKPMFRGALGETKEWADAATLNFEKALRFALNVSTVRKRVQVICEAFVQSDTNQEPDSSPKARVEIFIDESGKPSQQNFAVGGIVLISGAQPFDHERYRNAAMARGTGLWGIDDVFRYEDQEYFPDENLRLPKGDALFERPEFDEHWVNQRLGQISTIVESQNTVLIACALRSKQRPDLDNVLSHMHPFHRYRALLGRFLEAVLLHCEPVRAALQSGATIAIDAATAAHEDFGTNAWDLRRRFGTHVFGSHINPMCMTFSNSDLHPILADVLSRNKRTNTLGARVERARAIKLLAWEKCVNEGIIGGGPEDLLTPKPLHYLADWIAHIARSDEDLARVPNIPILKNWFQNGFAQDDGDDFKAQLRCHRRWSQDARVEAIRGWKEAAVGGGFALAPRMSQGGARWIESLKTDDLTTLFHSAKLT